MMNSRQTSTVVTIVGGLTAAIGTALYLSLRTPPNQMRVLDELPLGIKIGLAAVLLVAIVFTDFWFFFKAKSTAGKIAYFPFTILYIVMFLIMWLVGN